MRHLNKNAIVIVHFFCFMAFLACFGYGQDMPNKVTEGEFAVNLVKISGFQKYLPLAADTEDYIRFLEEMGISPLSGWDSRRQLTEDNYLAVMSTNIGLEKFFYERASKFCKRNIERINEVYQSNKGQLTLGQILQDKQFFPEGTPVCPWGGAYALSKGRVKAHNHIKPMLIFDKDTSSLNSPQTTAKKNTRWDTKMFMEFEEEYESNVLLSNTDVQHDFKTSLNPGIEVSYTNNDIYAGFLNANEMTYYPRMAEWTFKDRLIGRFSYYPSNGTSIGFSDNFIHTQKSDVGATIYDRILSLGYNLNYVSLSAKRPLTKNTTASFSYQMEYVNLTSTVYDPGPDKRTHRISINESYRLNARIFPFTEYYIKFIDFDHDHDKDAVLQGVTAGTFYKIPRLANAQFTVGWEKKFFTKINIFDKAPNLNGIVGAIDIKSTFSKYTHFIVGYYFRPLVESSGVNYKHYSSHSMELEASHKFRNDVILSAAGSYERQYFKERDSFSSGIGNLDVGIKTISCALTKEVKKDMWFAMRCSRSQRKSDFTDNGYTDNKVSLSLTSEF